MFASNSFAHIPCPEFQMGLCARPLCMFSHDVPLQYAPPVAPTETATNAPNQVTSLLNALASALGLQAQPQYPPTQPNYYPTAYPSYAQPAQQVQQYAPQPTYQAPLYSTFPPSYQNPTQQPAYAQTISPPAPSPQIQQFQAQLHRIQSQLQHLQPAHQKEPEPASTSTSQKRHRLADHLQQLQGKPSGPGYDYDLTPDDHFDHDPRATAAPVKVKSLASDTKWKRQKVTMSEQLKGKGAKSSLPTLGFLPNSGGSVIPSKTKKADKGKEKEKEDKGKEKKVIGRRPAEAGPQQRSQVPLPVSSSAKPKPATAPAPTISRMQQQLQQQQLLQPQPVAVSKKAAPKGGFLSKLGRSPKMMQIQKMTQNQSVVQMREQQKQRAERKRKLPPSSGSSSTSGNGEAGGDETEVLESGQQRQQGKGPAAKRIALSPEAAEKAKYERAKLVLQQQLKKEEAEMKKEKEKEDTKKGTRRQTQLWDPSLVPQGKPKVTKTVLKTPGGVKTKSPTSATTRRATPTTPTTTATGATKKKSGTKKAAATSPTTQTTSPTTQTTATTTTTTTPNPIPMAKPRRLVKLRTLEERTKDLPLMSEHKTSTTTPSTTTTTTTTPSSPIPPPPLPLAPSLTGSPSSSFGDLDAEPSLPSPILRREATKRKAKQREELRKKRQNLSQYNYLMDMSIVNSNNNNNSNNNGNNGGYYEDSEELIIEDEDSQAERRGYASTSSVGGPTVPGGSRAMEVVDVDELDEEEYEFVNEEEGEAMEEVSFEREVEEEEEEEEEEVEEDRGYSGAATAAPSASSVPLFDLRKVDNVMKIIPAQNYPFVPFDVNAKVSRNLRQQSVEKLLEEIMRQHYQYLHPKDSRHVVSADGHCYYCQKRAIEEAMTAEKKIYQECNGKPVYLNMCSKAMLKIRERGKSLALTS